MCGSGPDKRWRRCQLCDWLITLCSQWCHRAACGLRVVYSIFLFYLSFSMCLTPFDSFGLGVACGCRSVFGSADSAPPVSPTSRVRTREWRASGCSFYNPALFNMGKLHRCTSEWPHSLMSHWQQRRLPLIVHWNRFLWVSTVLEPNSFQHFQNWNLLEWRTKVPLFETVWQF